LAWVKTYDKAEVEGLEKKQYFDVFAFDKISVARSECHTVSLILFLK